MVKKMNSDRILEAFAYIVLFFVGAIAIFPLLYVLSVSLTPYSEYLRSTGIMLIPRKLTFSAYEAFLNDSTIPSAYKVSIFVTVVGTTVNLVATYLTAYALSRKTLPGRKIILFMIVFTMFFGGGLIPTYLVVKATGLIDSLWALILPVSISTYNLLIMKTFIDNLPIELIEAAKIDGASEMFTLRKIALPLSKSVIATIGLFYAVSHWNSFFSAILYITDRKKMPLQVILRGILMRSVNTEEMAFEEVLPTQTLQMAAVIITAAPVVMIYPFIQKHFTKGVLLGSIKG